MTSWTCPNPACIHHDTHTTAPPPPTIHHSEEGSKVLEDVLTPAYPSSSPPPTEEEIRAQRSIRFKKSEKKYTGWQRQWVQWVEQHNTNQHVDWLESDSHLEVFIVRLENKKIRDPHTNAKSDRPLYAPSTILVAIASLNALRTQSGRATLYKNTMFPQVGLAVKRLKQLTTTRRINKEEKKPAELTDEEIESAFCALPHTPAGYQCRLYLVLLRYLNHHSTKVVDKVVSDITIDPDGQWVEIFRGAEEKNSTTKTAPDPVPHVWLCAIPEKPFCCPVRIVQQHLKHLPSPTSPNERLFRNLSRKGALTKQNLGKNTVNKRLFEPVMAAIPQLTYRRERYESNSIRRAAANSAMAAAKERVIKETMRQTHHASTGGLQAYLTDESRDFRAVESAILQSECTHSIRNLQFLVNLI
jgi:hypothetical protein